jgi:hypothetical protein
MADDDTLNLPSFLIPGLHPTEDNCLIADTGFRFAELKDGDLERFVKSFKEVMELQPSFYALAPSPVRIGDN